MIGYSVAIVWVWALELYLVAGVVFAIWFVARGAGRLDPVATEGSWGFRLLIVPGTVLLWPLLIYRLATPGPKPPVEHNAHRDHRRPGEA